MPNLYAATGVQAHRPGFKDRAVIRLRCFGVRQDAAERMVRGDFVPLHQVPPTATNVEVAAGAERTEMEPTRFRVDYDHDGYRYYAVWIGPVPWQRITTWRTRLPSADLVG